jgi:hypothetical protein
MSQKISAAIADQMLLVLNNNAFNQYAQNNTKLHGKLSGQNMQSTPAVCAVTSVV